jgi:hypothetical protein
MRGEIVMRRTKTTEIIVETDEIFVVRQSSTAAAISAQSFCHECESAAELIAPELAAAIIGASTRAIYRLVEASLLHFAETPDGRLLICQNSLAELETPGATPKQISGA